MHIQPKHKTSYRKIKLKGIRNFLLLILWRKVKNMLIGKSINYLKQILIGSLPTPSLWWLGLWRTLVLRPFVRPYYVSGHTQSTFTQVPCIRVHCAYGFTTMSNSAHTSQTRKFIPCESNRKCTTWRFAGRTGI